MLPNLFELLDEMAILVTQPIKDLFAIIEVPHYASLLSSLSWFTDGTYDRYMIEANRPTNTPELRRALRQHGCSEKGHDIYAIRDLKALGFVRSPILPEEVRRLHRQIDGWETAAKLGCSASIETMSSLLYHDAMAMRRRLALRDDQFSFISLHLDADSGPQGHAAQLREIVQAHLFGAEWVAFVEGAMKGGRMWGEMVASALRSPLYASRSYASS